MSARRLILLAALALASACSKTSARPGLRFNGPSGVAVFHAKTATDPNAYRAYLAVANARGDDLRILDAIDGKAVLAPALIESLSVPTAPRPSHLAAGSLADAGGQGADLLAVAPAGLATCDPQASTRLVACVQIVHTWSEASAVERDLTLVIDDVTGGLGAPVVSLAVVPVPVSDGQGGFTAAPGQARLVAGLSGGYLLLADFGRVAGGEGIERLGAAVHDLGFEATSLAASPSAANLLYAASPDVPGVAELDLSLPVDQSPAFRVLAAGAPTTHVMAARVRPFVSLGADPTKDDVFGPEVTRIYAALDPAACGRDRPITCGLAVLDAATGALLPDPAGELSQYLPIDVLGTVVAMAPVYPPAVGGLSGDGSVAPDGVPGVLQALSTLGGTRHVSTLGAVALENGSVLLVDLARGALAIDHPALASASGLQLHVGLASSSTVATTQMRLGLWATVNGVDEVTTEVAVLPKAVRLTPGYTQNETWRVEWQGELPGLTALRGQLQPAEGGDAAWVAIQSGGGATPTSLPYRGVGRLYDPTLGVHVGDLVAFTPDDTVRCPRGTFELEVTAILVPSADHPGGAVQVVPRPLDQQPTSIEGTTVVPAEPDCLDGAGRSAGRVAFRSGGLLLTGNSFGYAGRPEVADGATGPLVSVAWSAADAALTCRFLDDPSWPLGADGTWPAEALCDGTCRSDCEALLRARRARRFTYVKDQCPGSDTLCKERNGNLPVVDPTGPVVEFRLGWIPAEADPASTAKKRGTLLTIPTVAGYLPIARRPASGTLETAALLPTGLATFDRALAATSATQGVRVFASYTGNEVYDFSPSQAAGSATVHR